MRQKKHLIIILITLLLSGCGGMQFHGLNPIDEIKLNYVYVKANNLASEARYLEAAKVLWGAAAGFPSPHKEKMQLESARMLINGQHLLNAHRQLIAIDEQALEPQDVLDKRILTAFFYQRIKQPEKIIALLPAELINQGDDALKKDALLLRADALKNTHKNIESLMTRIEAKDFLNKDEQPSNTNKIWQTLIAIDPIVAEEYLAKGVENQEMEAWLKLALIATPVQVDTAQLEQQYQNWVNEYDHLAVPDYVPEELLKRWAYFDFHPEKITLILPLTGEYASVGRIIRNGFLAAQKEAQTLSSTIALKPMQVNLYDSNQNRDIIALYQEATQRGTDMVIGPLLKKNVDALLNYDSLPTPVITLNYATNPKIVVKGEVFQFGLYPEDEAEQIARKLLDKEYNSIVVMAAADEWGERMVKRFTETYYKLQGTIQDTYYYDTEFGDYAPSVQSLFHLNQSIQRHTEIERLIEKKLEFKPRIRDDINAAVLFANHQNAALIYPLMKFYYADELPIYASSHAYEPGKEKLLRELDGLIYNDIPFILDNVRYPQSETVKEFPRLYALGRDAYRLINAIRRIAISGTELSGATGHISADKNRRLHRRLNWAIFNKGKPVALVHEK